MTVTLEEIKKVLRSDEPDYKATVAKFGTDLLPHLDQIANDPNPSLASKAISMASMIYDNRSINILKRCSMEKNPILRIAAATGARNIISVPVSKNIVSNISITPIVNFLAALKNDTDSAVRREAQKSLERFNDNKS